MRGMIYSTIFSYTVDIGAQYLKSVHSKKIPLIFLTVRHARNSVYLPNFVTNQGNLVSIWFPWQK
jgi:hypothetical protein